MNTPSSSVLKVEEVTGKIYFKDSEFKGLIVYTGALDEFFAFDHGTLPYRSLRFEFETLDKDYIQDSAVLNWPDERSATRRTEMKRLTGQKIKGVTSTIVEYPGAYERGNAAFGEPLYPIDQDECIALYKDYFERAKKFSNLILMGRLADYKYYNMEAVISRTLLLLSSNEGLVHNVTAALKDPRVACYVAPNLEEAQAVLKR